MSRDSEAVRSVLDGGGLLVAHSRVDAAGNVAEVGTGEHVVPEVDEVVLEPGEEVGATIEENGRGRGHPRASDGVSGAFAAFPQR